MRPRPTFAVVFAAVCALAVIARGAPSADDVREHEVRQAHLKVQTQKVAGEIGTIIDEFKRNGLGDGQDVQTLQAIQKVLGNLSAKDMERVIDLLQKARGVKDSNASAESLTQAYGGQKGIIAQLRQLLIEYQRQQELYQLAALFAQLADRQHVNLKSTIALAKATGGSKAIEQYQPPERQALEVQKTDQGALKAEAVLAMQELKKAQQSSEGDTAERLKKAVAFADKSDLVAALASAVENLNKGALFSATTGEKTVRDTLRDLSRLVSPEKEKVAALREALQRIERHITDQKAVNDTVKVPRTPKLNPLPLADEKQGDLVDEADITRKDLETIAPLPSDTVKQAEDRMQDVRGALNNGQPPQATDKGTQALTKLELARDQLKKELEQAEAEQNKPEDKIAALKSLIERVRELIKQEEALAQATEANKTNVQVLKDQAPKQAKVKDATRDVQRDALEESLDASRALGEAARQMERAIATFTAEPEPARALDNQRSAIEALKRAEQLLSKELAAAEQEKKDLDKLEQAREQIEKIIQEQQKVENQTAKEAAKQEKKDEQAKQDQNEPDQADKAKAKDLSQKQEDLSQKTDEARKDLPKQADDANQDLKNAKLNMDQAKNELDKPDTKQANPEQKEALADLNKAKNKLDEKINEMKKDLGLEPEPANLDDLAKKLDDLEKQLNQELAEMPQDPRQQAMRELEKEQRKLADDAKEMNKDPQAPREMREAQEPAEDAAKDLSENDPEEAAKEMDKSAKAMDKANEEKPDPKVQEMAKKQKELKAQAEELAKQPEEADPNKMKEASKEMEDTAEEMTKMQAEDKGQLPESVDEAMEKAAKKLSEASAKAEANQPHDAHKKGQEAQDELAKAKAAMQLAKQGMEQGKQMAKGDKKEPGDKPSTEEPNKGDGNRKDITGQGAGPGARGGAKDDASKFLALPPRERAAVLQSQKEKYPAEYGPQIEQYLKNLADQEQK